jgi:hypothetical protein
MYTLLLIFSSVIETLLNPRRWWPVHFYLHSPSLSKLPAGVQLPSLPYALFTRQWWYWHRQELVDDRTRPSYWPLPSDLLWGVAVAIVYTMVRYIFNECITSFAIRQMHLEPLPRLNDTNKPSAYIMLKLKQYVDVQHRVNARKRYYNSLARNATSNASLENSNDSHYDKQAHDKLIQQRLHDQHVLKQIYSDALAHMPTDAQHSHTVESNNTQLQQWLTDYTSDRARNNKLMKFKSAAWLFTAYTIMFVLGCYVSLTKDYVWDLSLLWKDWPSHHVTTDTYIYYLLETGHYLHLLVAEFFDIKKKDFVQMTIHHTVTLFLLYLSYMMNFTRIGVLVLVLHDASDVFLELAKLCNYSVSHLKTTIYQDTFFTVFAVVFLVTRLYIYPFYVFHAALVRSMEKNANLGMAPIYWVSLSSLDCLYIYSVHSNITYISLKNQTCNSRSLVCYYFFIIRCSMVCWVH